MSKTPLLPSFDVSDEVERVQALPEQKTVDVTQAMILDMAAGWEEPQVIAARYGYEGMAWERLREYKPFLQAVVAQRTELEKDGSILRSQLKVMGEEVLRKAYLLASGTETTYGQKMQFVEFAFKGADLMPKAAQAVAGGGGGQVTIVFTTAGKPDPMTIDMVETPKVEAA